MCIALHTDNTDTLINGIHSNLHLKGVYSLIYLKYQTLIHTTFILATIKQTKKTEHIHTAYTR